MHAIETLRLIFSILGLMDGAITQPTCDFFVFCQFIFNLKHTFFSVFFQFVDCLASHSSSSKPGVPNLPLTMYSFSILTDEHVPLQHFDR